MKYFSIAVLVLRFTPAGYSDASSSPPIAYARYGMVPSFFSNHAFLWSDLHAENLGEERAYYLSPMQSAVGLDIHFTNHNDYIVTPMDQLFTVWSAVNWVSRPVGSLPQINASALSRPLKLLR